MNASHGGNDSRTLLSQNGEKQTGGDADAITASSAKTAPDLSRLNEAEQEKSDVRVDEENNAVDIQPKESKQTDAPSATADVPYCILPERQKIFLMMLCSFAAMISPISSSIYFLALNSIGNDLGVSTNKMNLYITMFLVSTTQSGTLFVELRIRLTQLYRLRDYGCHTRTGLGPVIGGLIDHFLGWRWIFRFLIILAGVYAALVVMFLPETCRAVVGNGSVPSGRWNRSGWQVLSSTFRHGGEKRVPEPNYDTVQKRKRCPNIFASALIAIEKEPAFIFAYGALLYCGYMAVLSTLTSQLKTQYSFNSIQIGLCYLPLGCGSLTSRWTVGLLLDWNFKREAARQGMPIIKNRQQSIEKFNIEVAQLAITIPFVYGGALCLIAYGWVMQSKTSLAGPMLMLFFMGHLTTGASSSLTTLIVETNRQTAVAATNLWRCLTGAGAVAAAEPLIERIGLGWTATFIAFLWLAFSPLMWAIYKWGHCWREDLRKSRVNAV
ncbi:MFS transporter, putative [Talaromyces marneffei ATCC 18224]|uniref:MFS transporter, putative n=1 Tax=Talaromyces marneffei (strain ATCC 18224 / CBS 334.59 / QM 7333) TaxID=441960 RepID=B6Q5B4_TALMQ|nr:MFS transporter, putative [Talaromyces marneffei ATCC 18224]